MEILSVYRKRTGDKVLTAYIFQQIAKKGKAEGIDDLKRQRDARKWYRESAEKVKTVNKNRMMTDKENLVDKILLKDIGRMYMFFYDPKHKEELPYYDRFPLVLMLERYADSFLGINLHYLPLKYRLAFMDKLLDTGFTVTDDNDDPRRVRVTYDILAASRRLKEFKPCIKKYLHNHIRSRVLAVAPEEWDVALYLPVHQFRKENASTVWEESVDNIRNS